MVKKRLGELLLEAGVIDDAQLKAALGHQRKWGGKLGQALLDLRFAQESQIVAALARKLGYQAVSVASLPRTPELEAALKLVPRELALRQLLLPVAADHGSITVAMSDPSNIAVVDEVSFRTGRRVKIVLAGDREIGTAVRRLYFPDEEPPRPYVAAIALDETASQTPVEMTRDPFAAMPDHLREGYFHRAAAEAPPPVPGAAPVPLAGAPAPTLSRATSRPAGAPFNGQPPFAGVTLPGDRTARGDPGRAGPPAPPAQPLRRWPDEAPPPQLVPAAPEEIPGEPVLASDLAPADEPPEPPVSAERRTALLDALDRLGRGEDGLLRPEQLVAALARLLLRRGLVTEAELLAELARK